MAFLDEQGLSTFIYNSKNLFAKKNDIKFYMEATEPKDVPDGSVWMTPDELSESTVIEGKIKTVNGVAGDPSGNIQLSGYIGRNTTYSVGDILFSNNLPPLYYLECTTAGTTGATEADYERPK